MQKKLRITCNGAVNTLVLIVSVALIFLGHSYGEADPKVSEYNDPDALRGDLLDMIVNVDDGDADKKSIIDLDDIEDENEDENSNEAHNLSGEDAGQLLEAFCRGKKIKVTKKSELKSIASKWSDANSTLHCSRELMQMINEFISFMDESEGNACDSEVAYRYRDYYTKYLKKSKDKAVKKAPKWFKKFVIAFGMQISKNFRRNMLDKLSNPENNLYKISEKDSQLFNPWLAKVGLFKQFLHIVDDPRKVILPSDIAILLKGNDSAVVETMYVQTAAAKMLKEIKARCQKHLQPIYEPMIMPLTVLSGIGIDYIDGQLKSEEKRDYTAEMVSQWSSIVLVCEAMKFLEPVEYLDDESDAVVDGESSPTEEEAKKANKKALKLLTKEEADNINAKLLANHLLEQDESLDLEEPAPRVYDFHCRIGDVVLDQSNKDFKKAVNSIKSYRSKLKLIRGRMIYTGFGIVWKLLKKREFSVVASAASTAVWSRLKPRKSKWKSATKEGDSNKELMRIADTIAQKGKAHESEWTPEQIVLLVLSIIVCLGILAGLAVVVTKLVIAAIAVAASLSFLG
jgi:hypothetical protein